MNLAFILVLLLALISPPLLNAVYYKKVYAVIFSHDDQFALSGGTDNAVRLWDLKSRQQLRAFGKHQGNVLSVAFSADDRLALSGSVDKTLKLWDVQTGQEVRTFLGHSDVVTSVDFSADGRLAVSGSWDKTVRLWDVASGKELRTFNGHVDRVNSVAFTPDGRYVLSGSRDSSISVWDVTTGREANRINEAHPILSIARSPNSQTLLAGMVGTDDFGIRLWNIHTGQQIRSYAEEKGFFYNSFVGLSGDGRVALSIDSIHSLHIWDIETGKELTTILRDKTFDLSSAAISHDGKYILAGAVYFERLLRLYDVGTGQHVTTLKGSPPEPCEFRPFCG